MVHIYFALPNGFSNILKKNSEMLTEEKFSI